MLWMDGQKKRKHNFLSTFYHCFRWTQVDKVLENHPVALRWRQGYNLDKLPNTTTCKQIRVGSLRNANVFGLWKVAGEPGESPRKTQRELQSILYRPEIKGFLLYIKKDKHKATKPQQPGM